MQDQNFKNHARIVPLYHYVLLFAILALIIGSAINLVQSCQADNGLYSASLIFLLSVIVALLAFFARSFALKAQDRAIRAEENLRYFAITGKLLDSKLRTSQVIALRFAPNNELVDLAHKAVAENLSAKEIKQAIQNWRGDYHRV
ncbi:MAG: hypothetical protein EOO03_03450 [Chitinophagaceae bacterium]|nr:MAG: hypothetical protein EOO03_03450 [Chitinophagaceae bacterium]